MTTTRKTKAELIEEIHKLEAEIDKLENQKFEAANELRSLFDSYRSVGFDEQQSMDILLTMLKGSLNPQKVSLF